FDGFCGTGMTGVAAQLCGDKRTVESLGYYVDDEGNIYDQPPSPAGGRGAGGEGPISRLGARKAVLVDLSPAATFIAYNYNTPVDVAAFEREARRILQEVEDACGWMYETLHTDGKTKGRINYTVWSDVFMCPECGREMVFWDVAVDKEAGKVRKTFSCPHCGVEHHKRNLDRAWETMYDRALGQTVRRAKQIPVIINYSVGRSRYEKRPNADDLALIRKIEESDIPYKFPTDAIPQGDKTSDPFNIGITHIHHFYTRRNLWVLAAMWHQTKAAAQAIQPIMVFALTAAMRYLTRMSKLGTTYYFRGGGGAINAGILGTLYIPSFSSENNVLRTMSIRLPKLYRVLRQSFIRGSASISAQSASGLVRGPHRFVDYIFVDPPFGGNLMYSELNFLWETWLRVFTNNHPEAIVNKVQRKGLLEYQHLMEQCFREFYRVLKPGRWMTVEFHNSKNSIWNAIQEAMLRAGFVVADVRTFDKRQGTFNQITATGAVKQDLIISAYKPRTGFERRFLEQAGSEEGAWAFVRQHLERLPIVVEQDGALEVVAERQAYLLYDRMVAFHIQRGFSVPMGAAEFYAGLKQRFPERDGMYFLPHQVAEYDRRRLRAERVEQLALFVTDEKSAIQWLRQELDPATGSGPQTYQDLQPKFLRELHKARHEALPELSEMLAQNFLKDEQDRWYVPDPARQEDLEKLRERSLLREFQEYAQGKGRLRVFRTEAVRAGFKHAWHERDYRLIVKVAERLPESVLQEDASLLMYYDNALMRAESEPAQERLL
ncbi:MAG TPA: DNA methylase, partial [Anaerolineae bacterium]|nr:DNA methylase [Anaerolineae bacterium]